MPKLKKIFIIIAFLFSFFFINLKSHLVNPVYADQMQTQEEFEKTVSNSNFTKEDADKATLEDSVHTLNIAVLGPKTQALGKDGGAIGKVGSVIAYMVGHPPASTSEYLADLGSSLGLPVKSVYAQGVGWQALRPILPIWKAFRNISYIAFVIIFVAIGFMIMFRAKINPQTVVSIQAALPKIIVTLLLVTFSYAIAGLMIDLIYIVIYLMVAILQLGGLITNNGGQNVIDILLNKNPFTIVFMKNGSDIFVQAPGEALQKLIEGMFGNWFEETALGDIFGGLAKLVLGIAILFSLFKLFFSLLLCYLSIVLSIIFAPFNLLFNALPSSAAFTSWIKNLFANVIVFPAVAGLFLIGAVLIGPRNNAPCGDKNNMWCVASGVGFYPQARDNPVWVPPFLSLGDEGGGGDVNTFQALIALGLIMMAPSVVTMIKKALKVEGSGFGGAIVGGIMAGPKFIGAVPQVGWNLATQLGYAGIGPFSHRVHEPPASPTGGASATKPSG